MKVFLTILLTVLALPFLVVIGIAAGPAVLVILFIAGCALLVLGILWMFQWLWRGRIG